MENVSQTEWVLAQLLKGRKITPLIALDEFGVFRLSSSIHRIRRKGIAVETRMVQHSKRKDCEFAQYFMSKAEIYRVIKETEKQAA